MPQFFKGSKNIDESQDNQIDIETYFVHPKEQIINEVKSNSLIIPSKKKSNYLRKKLSNNRGKNLVKFQYDNGLNDQNKQAGNLLTESKKFRCVIVDCSPINFIDTVGVYTLKQVSSFCYLFLKIE